MMESSSSSALKSASSQSFDQPSNVEGDFRLAASSTASTGSLLDGSAAQLLDRLDLFLDREIGLFADLCEIKLDFWRKLIGAMNGE